MLAFVLAGVLFLAGCSEEPPLDYSQDTRDAFLTACVDPVGDELLTFRLCQCTFDRLQQDVAYARLAEIEKLLADNPEGAPLPDEVAQIVADCIVDEVEL